MVALVVLVFISVEALSFIALHVLETRYHLGYTPVVTASIAASHRRMLEDLLAGNTTYVTHSPALGWTIKPSGSSPLYRANSQGFRANRNYEPRPLASRLRIAAFGDSFTHGDDVGNADTWQEALARVNDRLEVLNFGVGGFGLDQAYLRYRQDGVAYQPHIILIGFMSENILRSLSVFRPFYVGGTSLPLSKPRFAIEDGRLTLIENPLKELSQYRELLDAPERVLPRLGTHDHYFRVRYRAGPLDVLPSVRVFKIARFDILHPHHVTMKNGYYVRDSEAFRVTALTFDAFVGDVTRDRSIPIIVLFPHSGDIVRHRKDGTRPYAPLLEYLREKGHRYLDLLDWFDAHGRDIAIHDLAPMHYTPLGNKLVANAVWNYLVRERLVDPTVLK